MHFVVAAVIPCCIVSDSEVRRLKGRKSLLFRTPLSFNALARSEPFECRDEPDLAKNWSLRALRWRTKHDPSLVLLDKMAECDRRTDGRTRCKNRSVDVMTEIGG